MSKDDPLEVAYRSIAEHVGCDLDHVLHVFEYTGPKLNHLRTEFLKSQEAAHKAVTQFATRLGALRREYEALPDQIHDYIFRCGGLTEAQLYNFEQVVEDAAQSILDRHLTQGAWGKGGKKRGNKIDFRGGKNFLAPDVATRVAVLFLELGRDVTSGQDPQYGDPNTDLGRAVKFSFEVLGVDADWREHCHTARRALARRRAHMEKP